VNLIRQITSAKRVQFSRAYRPIYAYS